jgi:hypothetical protein
VQETIVPLEKRPRAWLKGLIRRTSEGGLLRSSVVKCEDIQPVRRELFNPRPIGGPLSASRMAEIDRALVSALGIEAFS